MVIERGFRKTKNRGKIQPYQCNKCDKRFVEDKGFFRMRNTPEKITMCLDLYFCGASLRKIQKHLQVFMPHNCSHMTILRWIRKYCTQIDNYVQTLKPEVSPIMEMDEMELKTKKGVNFLIEGIDTKTRFIVSHYYSKKRDKQAIGRVLGITRNKAGKDVDIICTDAMPTYSAIMADVFGKDKISHTIINSSLTGEFNYKIERFHNSVRERTKTMRGFGSLESARAILKGYMIFYNFIRKHQVLGKCPYELALPDLEFESKNKWLELIELASSKKNKIKEI